MTRDELGQVLLDRLRAAGPMAAREARAYLGVSQPTFSRTIAALGDQVLTIGRARAVRYAARRSIDGVGPSLVIWEVQPDGTMAELGQLHALAPDGFCFTAATSARAETFDDLPWFLDGLRPSGYLGRQIPRRQPELALPDDVTRWSGDDCLRYATRFGWNLPGSFVVGHDAYGLVLRYALAPPDVVSRGDRARRYPELAERSLTWGVPGSSAAGEQPKFLATLGPDPFTPVLVKFSPSIDESVGRRVADLLVCEHLAHRLLEERGVAAARSTLLRSADRVFLEVERFDRPAGGGRRGVVSLETLDAVHSGAGGSWDHIARALQGVDVLSAAAVRQVRWLALFGRLVRNTDMHPGNLSFLLEGVEVGELAPVYDMLPMEHAPRHGNIIDLPFEPPLPEPQDADIWRQVWDAALEFWSRVGEHPDISPGFRDLAAANRAAVAGLEPIARMLPRAT